MIGYKVCSKEDGKYMSYCRFPGRANGINKWDILKCSGGTVFADDVTIMEEINV